MDSNVCARCANSIGGCCVVAEHEQLATLTLADVERLRQGGHRHFVEEEWLTVDEALAYERRRPLYGGYFRAGPVRLTLRRRAGACVFLDRKAGCSLAPELRPTACLLYPFERLWDGSWSVCVERHGLPVPSGTHACLAVEEASSMDEVWAAFRTDAHSIEAVGDRLRAEVLRHGRAPAHGRRAR